MMKDLKYAKGGKVIIQPNDYQKYKKIGIENKYEIEAFNDIGLSGINFDSVTLNKLLENKFNDLLESYEDYVISEDSEAITRTIQQEIEARRLQGDSLERIKEYEQMLTNKRSREQYIKDYADNQLKTLSEWVSYLKQSEYSTAFKYLLLKAVLNYNYDYKLNKLIERNNKTIRNFVGFDAASLAELNELNSDFLLKDYTEIQANNSANILKSKDVIKGDSNGRWIKFNGGKKTNEEERDKNSKELSHLVQNTYWCTKTNSKSQLKGGDFYVYVTETDGEVFPRIAIRMDESNVGEVRGNKSAAQDIEEEMLPIAEDFLENNIPNNSGKKWLNSIKYNSRVIAFKEKLIAEGTLFENSIENFFQIKLDEKKYLVDYAQSNGNVTQVQNIIQLYIEELSTNNLYYKKSDFGNITLELNGSRYSVFPMMKQKYFFGSLDFEQRDLPTIKTLYNYNLQHILGDADFRDSEIENLGNLITIGGNAEFIRSKVKDLGNLTSIGRDAYFSGSSIKDLGNLTKIGGNAYFENSEVENLGNLTTINGNAAFFKSKIKNLGNLTTIGDNAYFENSQIKNLGNLTSIGGTALFENSQVQNLGNLTTIGGNAYFEYSEVENLGNLTTIDGNARFEHSKIKDLGNLKNIGGDVTFGSFGNSELKDLGNLTTIGGYADFAGSSIKDLGNLTKIGGNAYFENSEVENLGNLTTINGNANFSKSKIKDLGNLTTINGNATFSNSEVRYLRKLTTIGGEAYFQDSKIIHLGNLRSVSSAEGKASMAYKLWIKRLKYIQEGKFENGGYLISDLLSSQEVEYKLGRELHWWNDDIVYLSGIKYKKVYLRPEYKKVIE